jgi:F0F1-type ATP synthase epsilon subunit
VAELAGDIDADRARRAKEAAERNEIDADDAEADAALRRANVRLELAGST